MNTLKDIFRPTRGKIIFSTLVGPALTVVGLFATGAARHGPDIIQYIALPLTLPYFVVVWLSLASEEFWLIALLIPAFVYWYIIFSVLGYFLVRIRR